MNLQRLFILIVLAGLAGGATVRAAESAPKRKAPGQSKSSRVAESEKGAIAAERAENDLGQLVEKCYEAKLRAIRAQSDEKYDDVLQEKRRVLGYFDQMIEILKNPEMKKEQSEDSLNNLKKEVQERIAGFPLVERNLEHLVEQMKPGPRRDLYQEGLTIERRYLAQWKEMARLLGLPED